MANETDVMQQELEDKAAKLRSARKAAASPEATERDKSDLKLIEQDFHAHKSKVARECESEAKPAKSGGLAKKMDQKLDSALKDSFPGSDPVSFLQATPVKDGDRDLTAVKVNEETAKKH